MNLSSQLAGANFDRPVVSPKDALKEYLGELSENSKRSRQVAFKLVSRFLQSKGIKTTYKELTSDVSAWRHLDPSFFVALREWMIDNGYSLQTIKSVRSMVLSQFRVLYNCGMINHQQYGAIFATAHLQPTKMESSKWYGRDGELTAEMVYRLKNDHDTTTSKGRRDKALLCILLNHGLRVGEVVTMDISDIDYANNTMTIVRHKSKRVGKINLLPETVAAIRDYTEKGGISDGRLIRHIDKGDNIRGGLSVRAVGKIFQRFVSDILNDEIALSPHDCRHYWATQRAADGATALQLMREGGWRSLDSVLVYVHDN